MSGGEPSLGVVILANAAAVGVVAISASYIWDIPWESPIIDIIVIATAVVLVSGEMVWLCWPRRERD